MVAHSPSAAAEQVRELLVSNLHLLYYFAARVHYGCATTRRTADVDDLAQELALRVLRNAKRFNPALCKFSTWVGAEANWMRQGLQREVYQSGESLVTNLGSVTHGHSEKMVDTFSLVADRGADDPAAAVALVRVLVPVEELSLGATALAWVRDQRTGKRVQVPAVDVVTWRGRMFAVAESFDEGDDELHRVRFGNDALAWVLAVVRN